MNKIVEDARALIGKATYVFGGDNPDTLTFDCSGFTQYIYRENGVALERTTSGQVMQGVSVTRNEMQAGDLVFFGGTYRAGVSHVGIYSGNGTFIHCQNAKVGCIETSLDNSYWSSHYYASRRVASYVEDADADKKKDGDNDNGVDLKWWGDVVVVVMVGLCIILGIMFLMGSFDLKKLKTT